MAVQKNNLIVFDDTFLSRQESIQRSSRPELSWISFMLKPVILSLRCRHFGFRLPDSRPYGNSFRSLINCNCYTQARKLATLRQLLACCCIAKHLLFTTLWATFPLTLPSPHKWGEGKNFYALAEVKRGIYEGFRQMLMKRHQSGCCLSEVSSAASGWIYNWQNRSIRR